MMPSRPILRLPLVAAGLLLSALVLISPANAAAPEPPDTTPEGLVRVKKSEAYLLYVRPGVDFAKYDMVVLVEPRIAFRANWKSDVNVNRPTARVSDDDMAKMIDAGKKMLIDEFGEELKKGGYLFATKTGPGVLAVSPAIWNLDVYAPDPGNMASVWGKTYSDGAGEATLELKLYDSSTGQLLAQALDQKGGGENQYSWSVPRSQATNKSDARYAFNAWARMLVEGLKRAKAVGTIPAVAPGK
jgi:hypothetical protein